MVSIEVKRIFQLSGHSAGIYVLAPGLKPHTVLSGSGDNIVAEWDLKEPVVLPFSIKLESTVYAMTHLGDRPRIAIGQGRGGIHIVDLRHRTELRHLAVHKKAVFDLRYIPQRDRFVALSADGSISVWDAETYELERHIPVGDIKMRRAGVSRDGKLLVTTGNDGRLRVFDTDFFNELYTFDAHEKSSNVAAFYPGDGKLVSGGWDGHLRLWDVENDFKLLKEIPAHNYAIYDITFNPDNKVFATASRDKTVKLWDAETLKPLARLDAKSGGHSHSVNALHWNEATGLLVSSGDDRKLVGWRVTHP